MPLPAQGDSTLSPLREFLAAMELPRYSSLMSFRWKQLGEGPLPEEIFHDAQALQEQLGASGDSLTWPLIGKAGEMAALMSMVSSQEVRRCRTCSESAKA